MANKLDDANADWILLLAQDAVPTRFPKNEPMNEPNNEPEKDPDPVPLRNDDDILEDAQDALVASVA